MIETYKDFNKTYTPEVSEAYPTEAAICNALSFAGYVLPQGLYPTNADSLANFMKDNENVDNFYKNYSPTLYKEYRSKMPGRYLPIDVVQVLIQSVNLWLEKDILNFEELTVEEIQEKVSNGNPVLIIATDNNTRSLIPILGIDDKSEWVAAMENTTIKELSAGIIKPTYSDKKWVITIKSAEPVI